MSEREFRNWIRYIAKHPLPMLRLEVYLAQIASVIAQTAGNEDVNIQTFMLNFSGEEKKKPQAKQDAGAIAAMLPAIGVRKLGQGRKKK